MTTCFAANRARARITVKGAVQGVGFRPFVHRLARELKLDGWVSNSAQGVSVEVEGIKTKLEEFLARLEKEPPALALIEDTECFFLDPVPYDGFAIRESAASGALTSFILPDIAVCNECLREVFEPGNRRYLYPFTNCTHCGPRFSVIEALPYDRSNTSMKDFAMCLECDREYHDPNDRRFHAQPNACPNCGPHLELWDPEGHCLQARQEALLKAAEEIRLGRVLAMKGIGGFQLIADARNEDAVKELRSRKHRQHKPFAVMFPSIDAIKDCCSVSGIEKELLESPAAPIVIVEQLPTGILARHRIAPSVAPQNPNLGVMLPYSPLHHLLMRQLDFPVVATSGNLTDEPICIEEHEALERLRGVADVFLAHNRPIARHVDDSVVRVMVERKMVLRRARGYAPMPVPLTHSDDSESVLALGAHLKNAVALNLGKQVFVSQHIGDLETAQALSAFRKSSTDLPRIYKASPRIIAHDLHPEYLSTKFARELRTSRAADSQCEITRQTVGVQHHYAHVLSCLAENGLSAPALGISWDGTGFGMDGTIWGGEFLLIDETSFSRFAHFRQFCLPGGDAAVKQPRRSALGLLWEILGEEVFGRVDLIPVRQFTETELTMLERMLASGINSPVTSSAGRLFDAVAAIIGLNQRASFEGQAAVELESLTALDVQSVYAFNLWKTSPVVFDWQSMIGGILDDVRQRERTSVIAAKFHNTLAEVAVAVARLAGEKKVLLTGGCFQNRYLVERTVKRLRDAGFVPYWHQHIPPNDGGIALGQIVAALRHLAVRQEPTEVCYAVSAAS